MWRRHLSLTLVHEKQRHLHLLLKKCSSKRLSFWIECSHWESRASAEHSEDGVCVEGNSWSAHSVCLFVSVFQLTTGLTICHCVCWCLKLEKVRDGGFWKVLNVVNEDIVAPWFAGFICCKGCFSVQAWVYLHILATMIFFDIMSVQSQNVGKFRQSDHK